MVVFPQRYYNDKGYEDSYCNAEEKMRMMVVDLQDFQMQKVDIPDSMICHPDFECTLVKYNDNEIIKVEGDEENVIFLWRMTFESFNRKGFSCQKKYINSTALSVTCEYINSNNGSGPALCRHSTEVYEDFLYVYGEKERSLDENELWRFDLSQ